MPFLRFFGWNALGGVSWALAYGLLGYFGGNAAAHVLEQIGVGAAIVLAVIVGVVARLEAPRAPAHPLQVAAAGPQAGRTKRSPLRRPRTASGWPGAGPCVPSSRGDERKRDGSAQQPADGIHRAECAAQGIARR